MTLDLRMAERDWSALRKQFQSSFRGYMAPETGRSPCLANVVAMTTMNSL